MRQTRKYGIFNKFNNYCRRQGNRNQTLLSGYLNSLSNKPSRRLNLVWY